MSFRKMLCVAFSLMIAAPSALAAPPAAGDTVLSLDVKEADGTSGQDTNTGSGIKTGHLQDGAVTDAKIAGPISGSKLGTHAHAQADVTGLPAALSAKADTLHAHDDLYPRRSARVVTVSSSADPLAAGAALMAALGSITDASASNPYVVKLEPGVYDIGRGVTISGGHYVDIEGSGEDITVIQNEGDPNIYLGAPVIEVWANREIRWLTIRDRGTTTHSGALVRLLETDQGAAAHEARMRFVKVDANGSGRMAINVRSSAVLEHVTVKSPCVNGAVVIEFHRYQSPTFEDCTIVSAGRAIVTALPFTLLGSTVAGSIEFYDQTAQTATIANSIVQAASPAGVALNARSQSVFRVFNSIVDGYAYGNLKCVGVVTSALDARTITCQ